MGGTLRGMCSKCTEASRLHYGGLTRRALKASGLEGTMLEVQEQLSQAVNIPGQLEAVLCSGTATAVVRSCWTVSNNAAPPAVGKLLG